MGDENNERRERIKPSVAGRKFVTQTHRGPELNRAGTTRANGANGTTAAAEFFNNNFPIIADYFTEKSLIERLKREKTDKAVFLRDNYPVPPEPKDLPRIKLRLERDFGKAKARAMMKNIEEMSYAAHGN